MNKYSVREFVVYVAVDDLPAVHFATALNEADAAAIAEAMNARAERSRIMVDARSWTRGKLSAAPADGEL